MTFSFVLLMGNRGRIVKGNTHFLSDWWVTYTSVCDALVALTGMNVTSAAGSHMRDKPQPTQTYTHTHHSQKKMWLRVNGTVTEEGKEIPSFDSFSIPPTRPCLTFPCSKIL